MNSPSATTSTYRSEPGGGPADPKVRNFVTLFALGGLVVLVSLFGRAEVSRWYHAQARNALMDRRYEDSIVAVNKALEWNPTSSELIDLRAVARLQNDDFEGSVGDFDSLLARSAGDGEIDEQEIAFMSQKASALQRLGRHTETLAIWDDIIAYRKEEFRMRDDHDSRYSYALSLNNRAYMVAQAFAATDDSESYDIKQALTQIEQSIAVRQVDDDALLLDTLGYLLLLNGRASDAIAPLVKAVVLTEQEHEIKRAELKKYMQTMPDQRRFQDALASLDEQFSIILHHRGEAYAAIGELEKAAEDINESLRLGYNPDKGIW